MSNNIIYDYLIKNKTIPSPAGCRYRKTHMLVTKGNNLFLKETGTIDIAEQIQTHRDGVDLSKMIQRFQRGDITVFERSNGYYGDVSGYETDPAKTILNNREIISEIGKNNSTGTQDPADGSAQASQNNSINESEENVNA